MTFEAWKLCKCRECQGEGGLQWFDCIINELDDAFQLGRKEGHRETALTCDLCSASSRNPIRAVWSDDNSHKGNEVDDGE